MRIGSGSQLERLEKARRRAQEIFELSSQKAVKLVKRAEKAMDTTANIVFQEAEKRFGAAYEGEGMEKPLRQQQSPVPRSASKEPKWEHLTPEEHQLQWALGASLAEFQGHGEQGSQVRPPPLAPGGKLDPTCLAELHLSVAELEGRSKRAEARAARAEGALAEEVAKLSEAGAEDGKLLRQLEDTSSLVEGLTGQLAVASDGLEEVTRRSEELEAQLLSAVQGLVQQGATGRATAKQRLRSLLQELELQEKPAAAQEPGAPEAAEEPPPGAQEAAQATAGTGEDAS